MLDTLGISVLHLANMLQPTPERTIDLVREHIALQIRRIAIERRTRGELVQLDANDIRTIIGSVRSYQREFISLCNGTEMGDRILPGVNRIIEQLQALLPEEVPV